MSSATPRIDFSSACRPVSWRFFCCWRARTRTSPPAATLPTTIAAAGRAQLRGSRMTDSSQSASSAAATSVSSERPRSRRSLSASGGSTGTRAERSRRSTRSTSLIAVLLEALLQLLDGPVDEHLGGPLGSPERSRDLSVVHSEREAHDQRLATVLRELRHALEDLLHLFAALHELLRVERLGQDAGVVQLGRRPARAVAVEVGGEVVGDPDQPGPQRPAVRLSLSSIEVAVGLKKGLLGQVLRVVVVAHPVVGVGVDVAYVRLVQLREVAVESLLVRHLFHSPRSLLPVLCRVGAAPRGAGRSDALEPLLGRGLAVEDAQ